MRGVDGFNRKDNISLMQLDDQIAQFDEQGYLFFPGLLDQDEAAALQQATPDLLNGQGPEVIREKDNSLKVLA